MILILLTIIGFFLRFSHLDFFPIHLEEAHGSLLSAEHIVYFLKIPVACLNGQVLLSYPALVWVFSHFFKNTLYVLRMPAVLIGTASIPMMYFFSREVFNKRTGIIAAVLITFLPFHVIQSHVGVDSILTIFFACLIFFTFFRAIKTQRVGLFFLPVMFLSFNVGYTYRAGIACVPIFLVGIFYLRHELRWVKRRWLVVGAGLFLLIQAPLIYLYFSGKVPLTYIRFFGLFGGEITELHLLSILKTILSNFQNNFVPSLRGFFVGKDGADYYFGNSLARFPFLVHFGSLIVIDIFVLLALKVQKRREQFIVIWILLGFLISWCFVVSYGLRYYFSIIPALLLAISYPIAMLGENGGKTLKLLGTALIGCYVILSLFQLYQFYEHSKGDSSERRSYSLGCEEAALYLSKLDDIEESYLKVMNASASPIYLYLADFLHLNRGYWFNRRYINRAARNPGKYYAVYWAPETHSAEFYHEDDYYYFDSFRKEHPDLKPIHTIYYPNGEPALNIYTYNKEAKEVTDFKQD